MSEEIKTLLEQQGKAFEEFKAANDERLKALAEGKAVSELESKTEALNAELTKLGKELGELAKKANRPEAAGDPKAAAHNEHKAAFDTFMRKGSDNGLGELQLKAVQIGVDSDGGYAVPELLDRNILNVLRDESPMRQVCKIITIGGVEYKKPVNLGGAGSGWVGETDPRPETSTPKLGEISPVMGEIYANPAATQRALDDMFFDAGAWLVSEVAYAFAEQESTAFISGDGTNKPKGILTYPTSADPDKTRPFGTIQFLNSGDAGGFAATGPADALIDMVQSMKRGYRTGANWMLNSMTLSAVRKWKDDSNNYIWQPSMQQGQPSLLLGYGVVENEDMPDVGAGSFPVMFGNFKRAYTIVDRYGIRTLRDPYTNKPYVHFYTTKRVGSMLEDTNAVKLLKIAA